jgi:hypothetical protein
VLELIVHTNGLKMAKLLSYLNANWIELAHGRFESVNIDINLQVLIIFSRLGL